MRSDLDTIAFAVHEQAPPALEVRVNFGMFAGREATPAEIDELAGQLLEKVNAVSIVSEARHEIDDNSEAAIHQVRIEIAPEAIPEAQVQREELADRLVETAERWADACIASRHVDIA